MQETKNIAGIEVEVNSLGENSCGILIVHGLGESAQSSLPFCAANYFYRKGYDVWRPTLYEADFFCKTPPVFDWPQQILLLRKIVLSMARRYQKIVIVGHSAGAAQAIYTTHSRIVAKALWDPSAICSDLELADYLDSMKDIRLSKSACKDFLQSIYYSKNDIPQQPELLVVRSQQYSYLKWPLNVLPAKYIEITNSDHFFSLNDGKNLTELFSKTLRFIKAQLCKRLKS